MEKIFNFFKKIPNYVWVLVVVLALTLSGGIVDMIISNNNAGNYSKPFTVPYVQENGEISDSYRTFVFMDSKIESSKSKIHSIWINFAEVPEGELLSGYQARTVGIYTATHDLTTTTGNATHGLGERRLEVDFIISGYWECIAIPNIEVVQTKPYVNIILDKDLVVNEIVIVGEEIDGGELFVLPAEVVGAGMVEHTPASDDTEELSPLDSAYRVLSDSIKELSTALLDNQSAFDVSCISPHADRFDYVGEIEEQNTIALKQSQYLYNALGLVHNESFYLFNNSNVLVTELTALGVAIFGNNAIGLKLIPLLFTLGAVILAFVIAKKVLKNGYYAVLASAIFAVALTSVTIFLAVICAPFVALFLCLAFYFMLDFYYKGINYSQERVTYIKLILSGVCLILAYLSKVTAIIFIVPLVALFVLRMLKDKEKFTSKISSVAENKTAQVKAIYKRTSVGAIISFVSGVVLGGMLLTMGFSLICGKIMCSYYGIDSMLEAIFHHTAEMFTNWL
ncbi:MAG: phospholipid carrier-dependent glycosyltransferase [Clostridia bacterium]|nr:phospholipid carrier-dependent glycosyltransferase [Clostridia bacterium]